MFKKLRRLGKFKVKFDYTFRKFKLRFALRLFYYDKVSHSYKLTEFSNANDTFKTTKRVTKKEYIQE